MTNKINGQISKINDVDVDIDTANEIYTINKNAFDYEPIDLNDSVTIVFDDKKDDVIVYFDESNNYKPIHHFIHEHLLSISITSIIIITLALLAIIPTSRIYITESVAKIMYTINPKMKYQLTHDQGIPVYQNERYYSNKTIKLDNIDFYISDYTLGITTIKNPNDDSVPIKNKAIAVLNMKITNNTKTSQNAYNLLVTKLDIRQKNMVLKLGYESNLINNLISQSEIKAHSTKDLKIILILDNKTDDISFIAKGKETKIVSYAINEDLINFKTLYPKENIYYTTFDQKAINSFINKIKPIQSDRKN